MNGTYRLVWGLSNFKDFDTLEAAQIAADKMLPLGMKMNKRDAASAPPYVISNVGIRDGIWGVVYDPSGFKTEPKEEE